MLHYVEKGQGPAIVFVHAFPLDHSMWDAQARFFADRYRVITPDILGFGGSQPALPWSIEQMGDELLSLVDHLEIQRLTLVGLSIGGYISLPFAAKHPDRIEKLVLAHTRARADNAVERENRSQMVTALQENGIEILPDSMLPRLLGANASGDLRDRIRRTILKASPNAAIFAVTAMRSRADATSLLPQLSCPTLVIAGDGDSILRVEDCRQMASAIPNARFDVIPNAGHLSNLEEPEQFNRALEQFLS
jgi:pimeloyl-ACP methyl ester carboxylesterase